MMPMRHPFSFPGSSILFSGRIHAEDLPPVVPLHAGSIN
jgi:hypothetical protein